MADFPDKAPVRDASPEDTGVRPSEAGTDTGVRDGGDATTPDAARDGGDGTACTTNAMCDSDELCCNGTCAATSDQSCTACGMACTDPRAPSCGDRTCECVEGTNKACDSGQTCAVIDGKRACVECANDNDCAMVEGKTFCEANKCVACKRGAMTDSSVDDVGCSGRTPICGPANACIGCDDSAPATACVAPLTCTPGLGCGGCKADAANVKVNGCGTGTPICKAVEGSTMCVGCTTNIECKLPEGQGYCVRSSGQCTNKCDSSAGVGANGCAGATPFCKAASGVEGGVDCQACSPADCTNGTFCATMGAKAGSCVGCRNNDDCPQNGLAPVCDATSFTCRARTMADCAAPTPILDGAGKCVECTTNTQCAGNPKGPICVVATQACGQCSTSADCPAATPTCNATSHVCEAGCTETLCSTNQATAKHCNTAMTQCVQCNTSTQCPVAPAGTPAAAMPLCSDGACVACTAFPGSNADRDAACSAKTTGARCFRPNNTMSNTYVGLCGTCEPMVAGDCPGASTCSATLLVCQ